MQQINRQWLLAKRPQGMVQVSDFQYAESPLPQPDLAAGEVLIRNLMVSFDPAMRGWMDDVPSYLPPVALGAPMRAGAVAQVISSSNAQLPVGTLVQGLFGWQDYAIANRAGDYPPTPIPAGLPLEMPLGVLGGSSLTAYFGLLEVGALKSTDTVVVSGAAGAVGCVSAQIAKLKGCRVIGIAGGADKCNWLTQTCGIDAAIDYKKENLEQRLAQLCPAGIDVFFDNVGGATLEAAIANMADHGRIVLCGAISGYNNEAPAPGPRNLMNLVVRRVRMEGFVLIDYMDRLAAGGAELGQWVFAGKIQYRNDILEGFENIPTTFLRLFSGQNNGKQLLKLADPA